MSTNNNNTQATTNQSINEQLIAVLRPVLHALPLEVVKAALPAEARGSEITDEAGAKWVKETAPDQVLGLMGWPSPGDMFSKEELIEYVRRHWAKQIFEPEEFISLVDWYISVKGVSVHDMFKHSSIESIFHEDDICEFIGDLDMDEVAQHMPEWKLVNWIKDSHLTEQALEVSDIKHLVGWHGCKISDLFNEADIREYVVKSTPTRWYSTDELTENIRPTELFDIDHILTDLSLSYDRLKSRVKDLEWEHHTETIALVEGGNE